ncbi:hypothetical protein HUG20_11400 [Salicibibacter cibi]|uniref:RNA polymerase sigma-70 region 2 domain-containing protein n=1 Tax=Salicibibacter cibi TaxID=2743001 RepID=A0A7T6ZBF8_9BACI|nr:hypothetical protein HUG20_11400 [Salicibibacter cibi]
MLQRLHIHSNHEDFLQAGYVGLWLAYQHHDAEREPFPLMPSFRVRAEMLTMLNKDATYYERHSFASNDQEPVDISHVRILDVRYRQSICLSKHVIRP